MKIVGPLCVCLRESVPATGRRGSLYSTKQKRGPSPHVVAIKRVAALPRHRYTVLMRTFITTFIVSLVVASTTVDARGEEVSALGNMADCKALPRTVQIVDRSKACGNNPAVILSGPYKRVFSAAFRWDDGSSAGQDRHPSRLNDASASSSPYKTQRRIRGSKQHVLCYGQFLTPNLPAPEQLTIKRSVSPKLDRFCVNFSD